ncbi:MAG: cell wall hydrolase [Hungatella sp.]|jgi:N-acetylmuramoyl-L-alanine amidase|nr:cell wall hydrolase [Hungatella sp.]
MIKTQRNTRAFVSALSAAAILALTVSGFGGGGRDALTAFAETPSVDSQNMADIVMEETKEAKSMEPRSEQPKEESHREREDRLEITDSADKGGLVVGYMMTRKVEKEEEREEKQAAAAGYTKEDYEVLLKIVEAEAGVCDSRGKILVANVVLNRVGSDEFPDTIRDVVYQPSQFSPVSNGSINTCKVTAQTVECVNRALAGEDYSQGALYFMNRSASRTGAVHWFDGRLTYLFSHERHEFFK